MQVLVQIGLVALGSALGGLLRWGVAIAFANLFGTSFPWGTLFINLSGSLFLGWFATIVSTQVLGDSAGLVRADNLRLLVAIGFTGAYTTFSTFEYETHELFGDGLSWKGLAYLAGSVFLGLVAVKIGVALAHLGRDTP